MAAATRDSCVPIEAVEVSAYTVPTDFPESDGTYAWNKTTLVLVETMAGSKRGLRVQLRRHRRGTIDPRFALWRSCAIATPWICPVRGRRWSVRSAILAGPASARWPFPPSMRACGT